MDIRETSLKICLCENKGNNIKTIVLAALVLVVAFFFISRLQVNGLILCMVVESGIESRFVSGVESGVESYCFYDIGSEPFVV